MLLGAATTVLLEDVAVPVRNLAKLCRGVNAMFHKFGYHDGSAFGHALEGNLHLVFTQGFETTAEVRPCCLLYDEYWRVCTRGTT